MKTEDKKMVERIMGTGTMGYAYEYPYGGGARKEYMLALTPENLANFIGARGCEVEKIIITDIADRNVGCMPRSEVMWENCAASGTDSAGRKRGR